MSTSRAASRPCPESLRPAAVTSRQQQMEVSGRSSTAYCAVVYLNEQASWLLRAIFYGHVIPAYSHLHHLPTLPHSYNLSTIGSHYPTPHTESSNNDRSHSQ